MTRAILSASNLGAAALCPAKPLLESPFAEQETEYSIRGTRLHPYFRTSLDRGPLSVDDRDLLERADNLSSDVVMRFLETIQADQIDEEPATTEEHEVELSGSVPGHADSIITWCGGRYACILDLKSGVRPADEAPDNYQLATYALLQFTRQAFETCCVAIIQPDAFGPRVTQAIYRAEDMLDVAYEVSRIYQATLDPEAAPVPGESQCRYCRAKTVCPAYRERFQQVQILRDRAITTLANDELLRVHQAVQFAQRIQQEVSEELRARIQSGAIPGRLRSKGSTRDLTDPIGLWGEVLLRYGQNHKFSAYDYEECRKLSFGAFEQLVQRLEGCTANRAKEIARDIVAPYVVETPKQPVPIPDPAISPLPSSP